jgi:hypothetical protein
MGEKGDTHTPQTAIIIVAPCRDCTNGAMIMELANMQWDMVHIVISEGLYFSISNMNDAMPAGGRRVNLGPSSSGLLTIKGRRTDMTNVMMEKAINAMLPMRPTWPVTSLASFTSAGASYRR